MKRDLRLERNNLHESTGVKNKEALLGAAGYNLGKLFRLFIFVSFFSLWSRLLALRR
jgi:hypothetical protein